MPRLLQNPNVRFFSKILLLFVALCFTFRIHFYSTEILSKPWDLGFHWISAIFLALRFDLSVFFQLFGPLLIISLIPGFRRSWALQRFLRSLSILLLLISSLVLYADRIYYMDSAKHLGYEAFAYFGKDFLLILTSFQNKFPASFISISLLSIFLIVSLPFLFIQKEFIPDPNWRSSAMETLLVLLGSLIFIRGGFQNSPLRVGNSLISEYLEVNYFVLNGIFSIITDLQGVKIPASEKMNRKEAVRIVQTEIYTPGYTFVNSDFPLLRRKTFRSKAISPNIVLVVLENWSGKFSDPNLGISVQGKIIAPNFHRIAKSGIYFENFFATGGRTANGMMSLLVGIPDRPGLTYIKSPQASNRFLGIGEVFQRAGYESLFLTGCDMEFDNQTELIPRFGYNRIIGKREIDSMNRFKLGAWGYDDGDVYQLLNENLKNSKKPLFVTLFTLSTHHPHKTPNQKFNIIDSDHPDSEYLNTYFYADYSIGEFLKEASKEVYFNNTIFIFVADHTHHRGLSYREDRQIPLLIYSPKLIKPDLRKDYASQLDIIPTLVGFIPTQVEFVAMGKDLMRTTSNSAYFAYSQAFGWIEGELFYFRSMDGKLSLPMRAKEPLGPLESCFVFPKICEPYLKKARAFYNLSSELMLENKISP